MTKFGRLGVALVLSSILAAPAMAKQINRHHPTGAACDPRDPGNPYSRTYDYLAWSAWRKRGSWDDPRTKKDGRKAAFFRFHVEPLRRRASKRRACSSLSVFLGRDLASPRSDGATNPRQRERGGISGAPPLWTAVSAGQLNRPFTITVHDIAGSHPQGL